MTTTSIEFKSVNESVLDAFTGGPLAGEFVRCAKCQCCYGAESVAALDEHNQGLCMCCNGPLPGIEKATTQD